MTESNPKFKIGDIVKLIRVPDAKPKPGILVIHKRYLGCDGVVEDVVENKSYRFYRVNLGEMRPIFWAGESMLEKVVLS